MDVPETNVGMGDNMTRKDVMVANLLQIAAGKFEYEQGKFREFSRKEMMEFANYALDPTKTKLTDEPSNGAREFVLSLEADQKPDHREYCPFLTDGSRACGCEVLTINWLVDQLKKAWGIGNTLSIE